MSDQNQIIVPFLKWAGGKRWLVSKYPDLFPTKFKRYCEPFLGSGSVYFHLKPSAALLADINVDLINTYLAIRSNWRLVSNHLQRHQAAHSSNHYYRQRETKSNSVYAEAARFIYLNRTCWNGLYRVNKLGKFNVPIGTKTSVILSTDDFKGISQLLRGAEIQISDFEPILEQAERGDFFFVDPPYTAAHNHNGFLKYNENLFSWEDQLRLRQCIENAVTRGAKVLVTNAYHKSVGDLYRGFKKIKLVRNSVLAGNPAYRGAYEEYAVRCW